MKIDSTQNQNIQIFNREAKTIDNAPSFIDTRDFYISSSDPQIGLILDPRQVFKTSAIGDKKETIPVKDMFITITGSPGSGKSTQGKMLAARYNIPHVSVGKLLRKEIADGTELGNRVKNFVKDGDLAPSDLIGAAVKNRLSQPDCKNGFILDGYPRRMEDVKYFESTLKDLNIKDFKMIGIEVSPESVAKRFESRRVCDQGHDYDLKNNPPEHDGVCDKDGHKLERRADDTPETIRHRFDIFKNETLPVINYFKEQNKYVPVNGEGNIDEVNGRFADVLDPDKENMNNK